MKAYSSSSKEPVFSEGFNVTTVNDDYRLITGDALDIQENSVTLVAEFSSENIKPAKEEIGIAYSINPDEVKLSSSTFVPYNSNDGNVYFVNVTDLNPGTTYYYCACVIINDKRFYGEVRSIQLSEIQFTEGELIDLGLSVKWRAYNLGADAIDENGKLYPWGSLYGVETINTDDCPKIKNISGTGYDAAWNVLGESYRIPTEDEWKELDEKCQWYWVYYKNRQGYRITGPNKNCIFLPADGWINYGGLTQNNSSGYYRIGTQNSADGDINSFTFKDGEYHHIIPTTPQWAISIRPVYDDKIISLKATGANEITGTSAKVNGIINYSNETNITERGIWYGTKEYPNSEEGNLVKYENGGNPNEITNLELNGLNINTTYYYCPYIMIDNMTYFGHPDKFTTLLEAEISTEEEVDLGLSVKWRGYNLGSTSPEGTEKKYSILHNNQSHYISGTINDPTVKEFGYSSWRTPDESEIEELKNKCTWIKTTYENVEGWQVISSNGKSIFLPMDKTNETTYYLCGETYKAINYYLKSIKLTSGIYSIEQINEGTSGYIRPVKD